LPSAIERRAGFAGRARLLDESLDQLGMLCEPSSGPLSAYDKGRCTKPLRGSWMTYACAVKQFFEWCEERQLKLADIEAITVATYIELIGVTASKSTVKQHLAAIPQLFDYLTTGGILAVKSGSVGTRAMCS
jgi:hypothetical protein